LLLAAKSDRGALIKHGVGTDFVETDLPPTDGAVRA